MKKRKNQKVLKFTKCYVTAGITSEREKYSRTRKFN